jgi:hypothetical protein
MAGMAAAWRLSEPGWEDRFERITVYQRGWRLGGKGASSRGVNERIEEHGLHIWLGYYENSFRVVRQVYDALDRETTAPETPIKTWTDAFQPVTDVGFEDFDGTRWKHWVATFRPNEELPGEGDAESGAMTVAVDESEAASGNEWLARGTCGCDPFSSRRGHPGCVDDSSLPAFGFSRVRVAGVTRLDVRKAALGASRSGRP